MRGQVLDLELSILIQLLYQPVLETVWHSAQAAPQLLLLTPQHLLYLHTRGQHLVLVLSILIHPLCQLELVMVLHLALMA